MNPKGLRFFTLEPGCGYGDAAAQYLYGLDQLGVSIRWSPSCGKPYAKGQRHHACDKAHPAIRQQLANMWQQPIEYDTVLMSMAPTNHYEDIMKMESGKRHFAYATWELNILPEHWTASLNKLDGLFTPSLFNQNVLRDCGVTIPIHLAPHVTRSLAAPVELAWAAELQDTFVFYTIGTWCTRKEMDLTIRAYLNTFSSDEPVCLVIKTGRRNLILQAQVLRETGGISERKNVECTTWFSLAKILADYDHPARIHLITEHLEPAAIDSIHGFGDCYISLTRSEGWGICSFDALQVGNPVIITGYGGQLDYLGSNYPLLVDYELEPCSVVATDGIFLDVPDGLWARPDLDHAGQLMKQVFSDPATAAGLGRDMQVRIKRQFAPKQVCKDMAGVMGLLT